jgi:hypothetical protein
MMRMERFSIGVCLVALFFATAAHADIVTDSAAFDKAYIPALALTSQGEAEKSKAAMARLNQAWRDFSNAHRKDNPDDDAWMQGFSEIDKWILEADMNVAHGDKLMDAHNVLEHVRVILMELRQKHGIDYYLDYQTAYHEPMEGIVLAAKGKTPVTLTEQDLAKIRNAIPELETRWNAVRSARFDPGSLGLDSTRTAKVKRSIELETESIDGLKHALAGSDRSAMIQQAVAIKPPFAQLYMLFGEFAQ